MSNPERGLYIQVPSNVWFNININILFTNYAKTENKNNTNFGITEAVEISKPIYFAHWKQTWIHTV